ncbi:mavicyanin-like [Cucumis melo var. makuwa]|uniref:Mavicyanin-like n=2 Tax=Cucumis melo TaxID=3656 RepID=A0A5D3D4N2_CUCMM|nr:mavicyanin-like [Cucumis melo]KAA0061324.1 mavicyanin-like [Cucumis melo var. makuwa]TYK18503.1 mavicyanin-like [Cucumis melo var. makuwa]
MSFLLCYSPFKPLPLAFFFLILLSFHFLPAISTDFLVGDSDGWSVPKPKEADKYNKWASHNRFNVDDTVHFKYEKDSVMMVTEEEYKQCVSPKPLFYENNGDSVVKLDRAGLFYFISGVSGHCQKGQRMIIKVLEPMSPPQPSTVPPEEKNGAAHSKLVSVSSSFLGMFFMLFIALFLSI